MLLCQTENSQKLQAISGLQPSHAGAGLRGHLTLRIPAQNGTAFSEHHAGLNLPRDWWGCSGFEFPTLRGDHSFQDEHGFSHVHMKDAASNFGKMGNTKSTMLIQAILQRCNLLQNHKTFGVCGGALRFSQEKELTVYNNSNQK